MAQAESGAEQRMLRRGGRQPLPVGARASGRASGIEAFQPLPALLWSGLVMKSAIGLAVLILDMVAIVNCVRGTLPTHKKLLWILLILVLPLVGMILYFLLGRK